MIDIVERLRAEATDNRRYEVNGTLAVEAADEITRLRAENEDYKRWAAQVTVEANEEVSSLRAENERLRAALINVMVGGNSLAQIIGADHPPHGTPYGEALAHYGSGVKYEAWCCWNSIMQARAALEGK